MVVRMRDGTRPAADDHHARHGDDQEQPQHTHPRDESDGDQVQPEQSLLLHLLNRRRLPDEVRLRHVVLRDLMASLCWGRILTLVLRMVGLWLVGASAGLAWL